MNLDAGLIKAILAHVASNPEHTLNNFNYSGITAEILNDHVKFLISEHLITGYSEADANHQRWWFPNGITEKGAEYLRKL